ncbi:MAG: GGDEF domain-containing protein [Synergistaceae bacterium]|nr:GGDEF domain-containing protein [Synergistaceae bacterium]
MNLNEINIYVPSDNLAEILKEAEPVNGLTCNIFSLRSGARIQKDSEILNVIITGKIPEKIRKDAKYVLCTQTPEDLDESQLALLYDIWSMPLSPELVRFYFRILQERIKSELRATSQELKYQKRILEMARQDYLTGLATRWYLQNYVEENANESNMTCIYFDLDHFKEVNDNYGHQAGDRALAATAEMLQNEFNDGFAARMGGDEFMIVLLGERSAGEVEEKVNAFMSKLMNYYHEEDNFTMKSLTVSAGIAQRLEGSDKSIDRLIHESDLALYEAKKAGRDCCKVYDSSMEKEHKDPE